MANHNSHSHSSPPLLMSYVLDRLVLQDVCKYQLHHQKQTSLQQSYKIGGTTIRVAKETDSKIDTNFDQEKKNRRFLLMLVLAVIIYISVAFV